MHFTTDLAITIGYFSLPDWYCKGNVQPTSENAQCMDSEEDIVITYKFENAHLLAKFHQFLTFTFQRQNKVKNELHIFLPVLEIWLHLFDWTEVIDLLNSCLVQVTKTSIAEVSQLNSMLGPVDLIQNVTVNVTKSSPQTLSTSRLCSPHNMKQNAILLIVKSGNIGIKIHVPVWISREAFSIFSEPQVPKKRPVNDSCNIDDGMDLAVVNAEIQCNSRDLWLSYHRFSFWKSMRLTFPEAGSAQFTFSSNFNVKVKKISVLLTDGRGSSKGPLLEILLRNLLLHANVAENKLEGSVTQLQLSIVRVHDKSALLNSAIMIDIHFTSTAQLNLNVTETLIEPQLIESMIQMSTSTVSQKSK
ncbi:hypothetical protein Acr_08g0007080 [Actinidia rufa]|uniref:Uncharacterized protein n=1 Tax=Actinidia rufa TaxID=165716 RepID=A0A7J0F0V4_9ERIC|nr:hypothetical protein Acr_08g0007080 [Actinidia rufa]